MEFFDEKDMEYWRKQADQGKAVILEIPVSMLLDLDIRSISRQKGQRISMDDLETWLKENREDINRALDEEKKELMDVEKLEKNLYDGSTGQENTNDNAGDNIDEMQDPSAKVSMIMAAETFSEEQIAVIAEAMMERLPDRYLLFFMKKEYSPKVMRQLKDYCTGLYKKEVSGNEGKPTMDAADFEAS